MDDELHAVLYSLSQSLETAMHFIVGREERERTIKMRKVREHYSAPAFVAWGGAREGLEGMPGSMQNVDS